MKILLPQADGSLATHVMKAAPVAVPAQRPPFNRIAYAAAHVVIDPVATADPWDAEAAIDWEATLAFRDHLHGLGFRIAEAMDTAQRGMGLGWPTARELIRRSLRHARSSGAELACGVGTDQLAPAAARTIGDVERAYHEQLDVVEGEGGRVILMCSRALAAVARSASDYTELYGRLLRRVKQPVILHWLGEMFDPALAGYWGSGDIAQALDTVADLIARHADKIDGIKVSLLDARWELALRRRLPPGVRMYTGDDFNYAELIEGDATGFSHALLGIFDPIAPAASAALSALAVGDAARFRALLDPTVALSREIFRAPTRHYKVGVVLLAWLNGHQRHFSMAGGVQSARGIVHCARVFELADACGVLRDPALACHRMRQLLAVGAGIEA
ncbi:dihydrodipicolinate synthase family protein [Aquabacterium humicola]|uniref:dihydrodipicolinate synthase family protein n=1 Tax=Aquabacterium humicola TaxID=3237377 RepID=UPI0025437E9F|nr:dihydrodipicolinate synthase family protein [Rubrivivax pictus]